MHSCSIPQQNDLQRFHTPIVDDFHRGLLVGSRLERQRHGSLEFFEQAFVQIGPDVALELYLTRIPPVLESGRIAPLLAPGENPGLQEVHHAQLFRSGRERPRNR